MKRTNFNKREKENEQNLIADNQSQIVFNIDEAASLDENLAFSENLTGYEK